jgi:hypothetical protein
MKKTEREEDKSKTNVMRDFFLDILQIPKPIEYTTSPKDLLRKHMMCNLMKHWALKMKKRI